MGAEKKYSQDYLDGFKAGVESAIKSLPFKQHYPYPYVGTPVAPNSIPYNPPLWWNQHYTAGTNPTPPIAT